MKFGSKEAPRNPAREPEMNWSTSILTKMTGVVLCTLMLLMFLLGLMIIHQQTREIKNEILSHGETALRGVVERYKDLAYLEIQAEDHFARAADSSSSPQPVSEMKFVSSFLDRYVTRVERGLVPLEPDEEVAGVGLLTSKGRYYASRAVPEVTGFLKETCRLVLENRSSTTSPVVREQTHLFAMGQAILSEEGKPAAAVVVALSKEVLTRKIQAMRREVFLIITLVILLLSFPILYFLQKWVVQPIREVSDASTEISDGNFNKRIPVRNTDEIGLLATSFNKMASSLNFRDERLSRGYEQIQSLKDYYDSIVSNAPVGIVTLDQRGAVAFQNPAFCEMLQDFKAKTPNKTKLQEIPALKETRVNEVFGRIMSGTIVEEEGFDVILPSGENKTFSVKGVPLLNEENFIHGALMIFLDITKRTDLESRLKETNTMLERTVEQRTQEIMRANENHKQTIHDLNRTNHELTKMSEALKESSQKIVEANRMKTEFLASMSHELRTPLNAIIGFSDLIYSGIDGPVNDKQKEDLQSIARSGRHLLHLINDILDLSKIEAGKISLKKKVIGVQSLLQEVYPMARNLIGEKPIEFRTNVKEGIQFFYADEGRILQILLNLISNAAKFTHRGEISLSVSRNSSPQGSSEEFLEFTISDTGMGIREQDLQTIFDEFNQINQSSRNQGGSGLGLSITKKLVALGGGKIWVESRYGEGSQFHFTVPSSSKNIARTEATTAVP